LQKGGVLSDPPGMWFDLEAVQLNFTDSSPYQIENVFLLEAPPERVFQIWATGEGLAEWFHDFKAARWTSSERGVGAERNVELKMLSVKERFLVWDPGKRLAFHIHAITLPLVTAMLEDLTFEPAGHRGTRFTWRIHYRTSLPMRLIHPLGRRIFGGMFKTSGEGLARYVKAHSG
jgi:uncharacterized protein YndB with AHSA1/START domain